MAYRLACERADRIAAVGIQAGSIEIPSCRPSRPVSVLAIHGNADSAELKTLLPATRMVDADGARIAMTHNGGPADGRLARMRTRFPEADAVIFGHSHIPLHETGADGFQIFNPGSATDRRRQPRHTMGIARAAGGRVAFELIDLD